MSIDPLVPSGQTSPDGQAYDVVSKINEMLAAEAAVGDLDETELGYLNGVVAGTSAANKAVVLDGDGTIDALDVDELSLGGTEVTASAAELNKLDGAGAVVASGTEAAHIADPAGAATDQDDEARAAIAVILDALEAFGIVAAS